MRTHPLEPFLPEVVPVEFAGSVQEVEAIDGGVRVTVASERFDPHRYDYYGTELVTTYRPRTSGTPLVFDVLAVEGGAFRLLVGSGQAPAPRPSPMLDGPVRLRSDVEVRDNDAELRLSGPAGTLVIDRDPFTIRLVSPDGHDTFTTRPWDHDGLRRQPRENVWHETEQRWLFHNRYAFPFGISADDRYRSVFFSAELAHDEHIWGFGEGYGGVDRRGTDQWLWLEEGYGNTSPAAYKQTPFWISSRGYGVFVHSGRAMRARVGSLDHTALSITVEDEQELDVFLLPGATPGEVVRRYCDLTGAPRVPPRWTLGYWMSRISYDTQEQVETIASQLREHRIPSDVIHIDTNWFPVEWECDLEFSEERFPDVPAMTARLRDQGFRVSLWQWPNLVVGSGMYMEGEEKGYLVKRDNGAAYVRSGFVRDAGLLDYSNSDTVAWVQDKMRRLLQQGISAVKVDFGEGAPPDGVYAGIDPRDAHNLYPLLYQQAVQEVVDEVHGDDGVLWARSAWAGSQRYPIHWSGDGVARYADLACVLRSMLSMGFSGFPYYSHDVGGFVGLPDGELYVRWLQLGIFSSHVRAHGMPPREPWAYGEQAERLSRDLLELRYRLLPYLDAAQVDAGATCVPVARALAWDFPDDRIARQVEDAYLFGPALLIAPILDAGDRRSVYLPSGTWTDWWTGTPIEGGRYLEVEAPLDRVPIWLRENHAVVLGPAQQFTDEVPADPVTVRLVRPAGQGTARGLVRRDQAVEVTWHTDGDRCSVEVSGAPGAVHVEVVGRTLEDVQLTGEQDRVEPDGTVVLVGATTAARTFTFTLAG
jgi:alpha-D-xyloside xylohydrolase